MQVIKRNGEIAEFDPDKIYQAVLKAAQTVYVLTDDLRQNLAQVTLPLQNTISLIACNAIWREVVMATISPFIFILNKSVKKKSGMQRTSHSFLNRLF